MSTKKFSEVGFDTIGIRYMNNLDEAIFNNTMVLDKYSRITKNEEILIVMRPSNDINKRTSLTNFRESLQRIYDLEKQYNLKRIGLFRVDFSIDFINSYDDKLYRLFLECLSIKRSNNGVFETRQPVNFKNRTGNFKISSYRTCTTIYNCSDKNRIGNMRLENRVSDIRAKDTIESRMAFEVNKFRNEIHCLDKFIPFVEDIYINFLLNEYKLTIGTKFKNFAEFVAWADKDNYILTERILKEVLEQSGVEIMFKRFTYEFRKKRISSLKFITKENLKSMTRLIRNEFKNMIQSTIE